MHDYFLSLFLCFFVMNDSALPFFTYYYAIGNCFPSPRFYPLTKVPLLVHWVLQDYLHSYSSLYILRLHNTITYWTILNQPSSLSSSSSSSPCGSSPPPTSSLTSMLILTLSWCHAEGHQARTGEGERAPVRARNDWPEIRSFRYIYSHGSTSRWPGHPVCCVHRAVLVPTCGLNQSI